MHVVKSECHGGYFPGYQQEDWIISRACGSGLYTTARLFGLRTLKPRMICKLKLKAPRHYFATARLFIHTSYMPFNLDLLYRSYARRRSNSQVIYLQFGCFNVYSLDTGFQVKLHDTPRYIVDDDALLEDSGTWKAALIFDTRPSTIDIDIIAFHATRHRTWRITTEYPTI
ncbi:predicted protein [Lichtheimia corymbifera JMRC:FSU:9682]|uniref:Uncharacterized protein n=1 Tax=Lichtheimia corymbifera JMRC:FSU:9682 TaxID=1263082 RepID=A0A068SGT8_9FUNG|nr:predicted protein [Lichtheimia corymbifera JMRC:FSU:9682]